MLTPSQIREILRIVQGRRAGRPLQYLTGFQQFRSIDLEVGPGVFVPRPETEVLVERVLGRLRALEHPVVADLGTGSGAIALAVSREHPGASVWASEISPAAFAWAQRNVARHRPAAMTLLEGDLFAPFPSGLLGNFDLVASNPPYLSTEELAAAPRDVRNEPPVALVSGSDPLTTSRRIVRDARPWLKPGGWLVIETWSNLWPRLQDAMRDHYSGPTIYPDLAGRLRVAEACRG